jgi:hypothetical protein
MDFVKAFDSINRKALWFHMQKTGVGENMINWITIIYQDIKFFVKCGEKLISSCALQRKGLCQVCGFRPYLILYK